MQDEGRALDDNAVHWPSFAAGFGIGLLLGCTLLAAFIR